MDLHKIPSLTDMHDMQAATRFTFDVAADLLSAQREFAVQLTQMLLPAKTPRLKAGLQPPHLTSRRIPMCTADRMHEVAGPPHDMP